MLTRRESRAVALQTLFNLDFRKGKGYDEFYEYALSDFFDTKEELGKEVERIEKDEYSYKLVKSILEKKDLIDEVIKKAAPEWPLENISFLDRNILRIGIYELLFGEEKIPAPVVINEAIVLAKMFNPKDDADKFIAGVMGTVLEASGINEDESRKRIEKEKKIKYGFLPYYIDSNRKVWVALVFNIFNKWTLPKGSVVGEFPDEESAILDIAKRKLNISGKVGEYIGRHTYSAGIVNDKRVIKDINYYLLEIENKDDLRLDPKLEGLNEVRFFGLDELEKIDTYEDVLPLFNKAKEILE